MTAPSYPTSSTASQPPPLRESRRIEALLALGLLDTPEEPRFSRVVHSAARQLATPIAVITLVDSARLWFKAAVGLPFTEITRDGGYCDHTINYGDLLVIPDTLADPRFADNYLTTHAPYVRFYAGVPLTTQDGCAVGTLAIMDSQPRRFSQAERTALLDLAAWAQDEILVTEMRQSLADSSAFVSSLAQDIRTPLLVSTSAADTLMRLRLDEDQTELTDMIRSNNEILLAVVNSAHDFARLMDGAVALESTEFEIRALLEQTLSAVVHHAQQKDIRITLPVAAGTPDIVKTDADVVQKALVLLVDNVVRYSLPGQLEIRTDLVTIPDGELLRFQICPPGLAPTKASPQYLFQPFIYPISHRYDGNGLDLMICRRLVKLAGGETGIEGGKAPIFWFTIPVERFEAAEPEEIVQPEVEIPAQDEPKPPAPATQHILLVEDNEINQKITLRQLTKMGFTADAVAGGIEAVASVADGQYDLVLMDCQMPGMDGFEATRRIRKAEARRNVHIPIIAMTANALEGDRDVCIAAGMDDYIAKPVSIEQLRTVVTRWMPGGPKPEPTEPVAVQPPEPVAPAAPPPQNGVLLDPQAIMNLRSLVPPAQVISLIDDFLKNSAELLVGMSLANAAGDTETLIRIAHTLKSSSANYGARNFAILCKELEHSARLGHLDDASSRISRIEAEYINVKQALEDERNRGSE